MESVWKLVEQAKEQKDTVKIKESGKDTFMYAQYAQSSLGETIRQLRRQRSLTQTELGGEHFSKSYVSAVERDKIVPSYEAMRFFTDRLGQTTGYLEHLYEQNELSKRNGSTQVMNAITTVLTPSESFSMVNDPTSHENFLLLLDTVLQHAEQYPLISEQLVFTGDISELIVTLPPQFQGRFAFLLGLREMQNGNLQASLFALEHALTLAPARYQPAVLDAIGMNHYKGKDYHLSLSYFLRALRLLDETELQKFAGKRITDIQNGDSIHEWREKDSLAILCLRVLFHVGNAYAALGAHQQAKSYYERAYQLLSAHIDIETVGQLLHHLGYSTYAYTYQRMQYPEAQNEIESGFQHAVGYFVQARTVYQVGGDQRHESQVRLLQAETLLDTCSWRKQLAKAQAKHLGKLPHMNTVSLLDEAEEQCRQILVKWLPSRHTSATIPFADELEVYLYSSMAYMIRIFTERANIARLGGYDDTAKRERSLAVHYCQQLLNTLSKETFPWQLAHEMTTMLHERVQYNSLPLPRLPQSSSPRQALSLTPLYYAASLIIEELGYTGTHSDYIFDAYTMSNECIHRMLNNAHLAYDEKLVDVSYMVRLYQRCILLLEEREEIAAKQEVQVDGTLRSVLKDGLQELTIPVL